MTPESTVAEKSLKPDPVPSFNGVFEIDLSQDDSDDNLSELNKKYDTTNPTTLVQKHADETNKKKSNIIDAPSSVSKSSQPSMPPPPPPPSQRQTSCVLLNKRQRTRSTGVRHKVSNID